MAAGRMDIWHGWSVWGLVLWIIVHLGEDGLPVFASQVLYQYRRIRIPVTLSGERSLRRMYPQDRMADGSDTRLERISDDDDEVRR